MMTFEWTLVQNKRRPRLSGWREEPRQPTQQGTWYPGGRGFGIGRRGMERAFPPSQWGGGTRFSRPNPIPNRPVPPSFSRPPFGPRQSSRYLGPQSASYASVTRRNTQMGQNYGRRPPPNTYIPPTPKFARTVNKMCTITKMVHHLQNVSTKAETQPKMIAKMVDQLATMIHPVASNPKTQDMIIGNAKNWGHSTLIILEEHYERELEKNLNELATDLDKEWKIPFEVATRRAKKHVPRIQQESIDHALALIASKVDLEEEQPGISRGMSTQTQEQPQIITNKPQEQSQTTTSRPQQTPTNTHQIQVQVHIPSRPQETSTQTHTTYLTTDPTPSQREMATMTDRISDWSPDIPTTQSPVLVLTPRPISAPFPKGRRTKRTPKSTSKISTHTHPSVLDENDSLLGIEVEEELELLDVTPTHKNTPKTYKRTTVDTQSTPILQPTQSNNTETPQLTPLLGLQTSTPTPKTYKATRHINTPSRNKEWRISIWKKWLFIGDSNVSRFPEHQFQDLQIDSFPGTTFRNAVKIITESKEQNQSVEKIVLSFGINSRHSKPKETSIKQLQMAVRATKKKYPQAEIWIPIINYSHELRDSEKRNLSQLNDHISRNYTHIPPIPQEQFETQPDKIHWTRTTANVILNHWTQTLNLQAP